MQPSAQRRQRRLKNIGSLLHTVVVRRFALVALSLGVALTAAAAALAGPNDPRLHKRAADVRMAKTLILKRADLPAGFVDKGPQKNSGPTPDVPCQEPNLHALVMTADVSSHDFVRQHAGAYAETSSEASFFLREAQAVKAVAAVTNPKLATCLKKAVIKSATKSSNGTLKVVSAHVTPISESVADLRVKLWDILVAFKVQGHVLHDELVLAYFRRGRVVSSLMVNSLNGLTEEESKNISQTLTVRLESLPKSVVR
jgi:hypothetical protein